MWLCNFCAAGALTVSALEMHWPRGIKRCIFCKEEKSCQDVDVLDATLWLEPELRMTLTKGKDDV